MGGKDTTNSALTNEDVIDKLKRILKCLELEGGEVNKIDDEGDEWFKARKEKLKVPDDKRVAEMKAMIAEKYKQEDQEKTPETVLNTIYPTKDKDVGSKEEKIPGSCKKPEIPPLKETKSEEPSQTDMKNFREHGLLHGPYTDPFFVEMTMGNVIVGCQCTKRNGLQGDCQRKLCRGKKTCLNLPLPTCVPSGFGKVKPKEIKIFIGDSPSCPKEDASAHEKKVKTQKNQDSIRRDYIDNPPIIPQRKGCDIHMKGIYYIRPLRRNKKTQTGEETLTKEVPPKIYPTCPPVQAVAL